MSVLKVSAKSNPNSIAGALAGLWEKMGQLRFRQLVPERWIKL